MTSLRTGIVLCCLAALGCASTDPRPAFSDVASATESRVGAKAHWSAGSKADGDVDRAVGELLKKPLDVDGAVQIGLLRNRNLQAAYEELSIAQADLVQAGLLRNPTLSGAARFPIAGEALSELGADIVIDFVDLLMIPAKKRVAASALSAAKLRVADAVLRHAHKTRAAYYTYQAALQIAALRHTLLEAGEAQALLAKKQHEAGNISELDLAVQEAAAEQLGVDAARADLDAATSREELTRAMGLFGAEAGYVVPAKLPELPAVEPPLEKLETLAVERRFDLAAAKQDTQTTSFALAMASTHRWLPVSAVGASIVRSHEGPTLLGPTAEVELPIFDQKQALIAKLESELRAAKAREGALAVEVRSEVRSARARVLSGRDIVVRYQKVLLPLRERVVTLSQQHYDAMLMGASQLIAARQAEIGAYRELVESLRDYWIARADLERALGGRSEGKKTP